MTNYFYVDETPVVPDSWIIRVNHEALQLKPTVGSYNLLMARFLNLSYADYLRLCRDSFQATIIGKNTYYPVAYFKDKLLANELCRLLNARVEYVLCVKKTPDHEQHKQAIIKMQKEQEELVNARSRSIPTSVK